MPRFMERTVWAMMVMFLVIVVAFMTAGLRHHGVAFTGLSHERDSIVAEAARYAGMPAALAVAVSHVENWGGDSAVVHPVSGATGLMQVLPRTWGDSFRVECGPDSLINRWRNACVGAHIAVRYFRECGDWDCALIRYVGALCVTADGPQRCAKKQATGNEYVRDVMRSLYRTDLSPARDLLSVGGWRQDVMP